ncbi:WXG100 family type VII secretion target [Nocardioides terrisoli]|uniref:hypothetical protein n=1 Tax=Nocardioides terrisoli TaxID=3388267 RepID=UPI00287B98FF|nr:hypothetical protein [Nocardioides marmorisolisilvae]
MPDLKVDVDGLAQVNSSLRTVAHGLDDTRSNIDAVRADLGSGDVWEALDHFESHWDDGRGQLKKNMAGIESAIDGAVKEYRGADQKLADALHKQATTNHSVAAS